MIEVRFGCHRIVTIARGVSEAQAHFAIALARSPMLCRLEPRAKHDRDWPCDWRTLCLIWAEPWEAGRYSELGSVNSPVCQRAIGSCLPQRQSRL